MFSFRWEGTCRMISDWLSMEDMPEGALVIKLGSDVVDKGDYKDTDGVKNGFAIRVFVLPASDEACWIYVQLFPRSLAQLKVFTIDKIIII